MKFTEHLQAHLTPEWRTQYIQYENLKAFISDCVEENKKQGSQSQDIFFLDRDKIFFFHCTKELEKINNFFSEKLAEAKRKFASLQEELEEYYDHEANSKSFNLGASLASLIHRRGTTVSYGPSNKSASHFPMINSFLHLETSGHPPPPALSLLGKVSCEKPMESQPMVAFTGACGDDKDDISVLVRSAPSLQSFMRHRRSSGMDEILAGAAEMAANKFSHHSTSDKPSKKKKKNKEQKRRVKKLHAIKLGFSEFYLSLILLQNYQTLNFTGFRKILKKHDKLFETSTGHQWRQQNVDHSFFNTNKEVDELIRQVEDVYTLKLELGDRQKAMKRLRVPPLTEQENPIKTFRIGFLFGIFSMQILVMILTIIFLPHKLSWDTFVELFRLPLIVAIFLLFMGFNVYGWRSCGVNHVLIFEIDPRNHLTHLEIFELSGGMLVLWATAVLYYLYSPRLGTPALIGPFFLLVFMVLFTINPFTFGYSKSRFWFLRIMKRIFLAPIYPVKFADFWLADQLTSLAILFTDVPFLACFYSFDVHWSTFEPSWLNDKNSTVLTADVISMSQCGQSDVHFFLTYICLALPSWFRFAQCLRRYYDMKQKRLFPHLLNAGKYSTSFLVVIFGALHKKQVDNGAVLAFTIIANLIATCYTYYWDIFQDWGLMNSWEKETLLLRDELVYRRKGFYYFAMIEDLFLRLSWSFHLAAGFYGWTYLLYLKHILLLGEVIRRFIWNFFRLENEHLNNCGQFRAVRDIFIAPIQRPRAGDHSPDEVPRGVRNILKKPARILTNVARQAVGLDSGQPVSKSRRHTHANLQSLVTSNEEDMQTQSVVKHQRPVTLHHSLECINKVALNVKWNLGKEAPQNLKLQDKVTSSSDEGTEPLTFIV